VPFAAPHDATFSVFFLEKTDPQTSRPRVSDVPTTGTGGMKVRDDLRSVTDTGSLPITVVFLNLLIPRNREFPAHSIGIALRRQTRAQTARSALRQKDWGRATGCPYPVKFGRRSPSLFRKQKRYLDAKSPNRVLVAGYRYELTGHGLEIETIVEIQQHGIVVLVLAFYPA
jgi:hypothetical protein